MDSRMVSKNKLQYLARKKELDIVMLEKDYILTVFLHSLKDYEGFYFKGGTAINKILLNHIRLSEDLDFTITITLAKAKSIFEKIIKNNSEFFTKLSYDRSGEHFTRFIVYYKSYFSENATIILDLNRKAKLFLTPERNVIKNFYGLKFEFNTLSREEMVAEKISALINRNRPRDYFDVYQLIKKKIPIKMKLVKKKSEGRHDGFDLTKIFNKTNKIYSKWENDLSHLTNKMIPFKKVIMTIKKHFGYKK